MVKRKTLKTAVLAIGGAVVVGAVAFSLMQKGEATPPPPPSGPTFELISPVPETAYPNLSEPRVHIISEAGVSLDPANHPSFFDDYSGTNQWYWIFLESGTIYDGIWKLVPTDPTNISQGWTTRTISGTYHFSFGAMDTQGQVGWVHGTYTIQNTEEVVNAEIVSATVTVI